MPSLNSNACFHHFRHARKQDRQNTPPRNPPPPTNTPNQPSRLPRSKSRMSVTHPETINQAGVKSAGVLSTPHHRPAKTNKRQFPPPPPASSGEPQRKPAGESRRSSLACTSRAIARGFPTETSWRSHGRGSNAAGEPHHRTRLPRPRNPHLDHAESHPMQKRPFSPRSAPSINCYLVQNFFFSLSLSRKCNSAASPEFVFLLAGFVRPPPNSREEGFPKKVDRRWVGGGG
jgi:hypothetical protein